MTCPRCGTVAADGLVRCRRCGGTLAEPASRPALAIPVPRAPTNRGEAAQRAAGIVTQILARPRAAAPASAQGAAPAPWEVGAGAPVPPPPQLAPAPVATALLPPPLDPIDPAAPLPDGVVVPPPPPPLPDGAGRGEPARRDPPTLTDVTLTGIRPAGGRPAADRPVGERPAEGGPDGRAAEGRAADGRRRGEDPVPALDAPWPPPPGPWSGRRPGSS